MKKVLFISDLDGTLLHPDKKIDKFSRDVINSLDGSNFSFTVSSARSPATMKGILGDLKLSAPAVILNGTALYDFEKGEYSNIEIIHPDIVRKIIDISGKFNLHGYYYSIKGDLISAFYSGNLNAFEQNFMDSRIKNTGKVFIKTDTYDDCMSHKISFFSCPGEKEATSKVAEELRKIDGINVEHYHNVYTENEWYLEICSEKASKRNGIKKLKNLYGFDHIIAFGDNLNDIPMFEEADESYAVGNAKEPAKKAADKVIESNTENGVANQILRIINNQ